MVPFYHHHVLGQVLQCLSGQAGGDAGLVGNLDAGASPRRGHGYQTSYSPRGVS